MDRVEYIQRLEKKLGALPPEEHKSAIQYYEEYFDEAGPENEQKVIEELGPPEKVGAMIRANHAVQDMEKSNGSTGKSIKTIFVVMLAIFAAPIAIPIAFAIFVVIASLVFSLLVVFFSLFAAGISAAAGGFFTIIAAIFVIIQSPATFVFFTGTGLTAMAIGVALLIITIYICKISFSWLADMAGKLVLGRRRKWKSQ